MDVYTVSICETWVLNETGQDWSGAPELGLSPREILGKILEKIGQGWTKWYEMRGEVTKYCFTELCLYMSPVS